MNKKPLWYRMIELNSFRTITKLFNKWYLKHKNFTAVVKTAEEYPHANVYRTQQILESLNIMKHDILSDKIIYDEKKLNEIITHIQNEERNENV